MSDLASRHTGPTPADPSQDGTLALYDAFATDYDPSFEARSLRGIYDQIAWEHVAALLPPAPADVLDVGCGTGRWVARCLSIGHRVAGIEPAPGMQRVLRRKFAGSAFEQIDAGVEDAVLAPNSFDAVLAMGSLQYAADPAGAMRRMVGWLRPKGVICLHVDGLVALTLELLRLGRTDEALARLEQGWGIFTYKGHEARLHLFDRGRITALLAGAGLVDVETRGLLVLPSACGRARAEAALAADEAAFAVTERRLSAVAAMTDAGKHIIAWGRRA